MKSQILTASAMSLIAAATLFGATADTKMEPANQMLATALTNMYKLNFMRARADLKAGSKTALIQAGLTKDAMVMDVVGFDGKKSLGVLAGTDSRLSADNGKTWMADKEEIGVTRYRMVIAPIAAGAKIPQAGKFAIAGTETIDGMTATKIVGGDKTKIEYWLIDHPQFGKLVKKAHAIVTVSGTDIDNVVSYGEFNKPVTIPAVK